MSSDPSASKIAHRGILLRLAPLFFISGAIALIYEVVWFRQLHLVLGVSVFAVGAVVTAFMLGLALGSYWIAGRDLGRLDRGRPLRMYAALEAGIGVWGLLFPAILAGLELIYIQVFSALSGHAVPLTLVRFILASAILLPPTFLMGATLPALTRAVALSASRPVFGAAWLYALNTAGAVGGTVFAGFFSLERFGIAGTLRIAMVLNFLIAAIAWLVPAPRPAVDLFGTSRGGGGGRARGRG
jgi:spermidine synthase